MSDFVAVMEKGKPAVMDRKTRVFYWGYSSLAEAKRAADQLNKP